MSSSTRLSRDEVAKKKAIEEARKAGQLPPEVDNEGNMINPHIPEFMSKAPWYLNQEEGAGLKHQRDAKKKLEKETLGAWYKRGKDVFVKGRKAASFRKGACKNCGAMTHKERECLERPRSTKKSAWKMGKTLARDEVKQQQLNLDYEGSRDRWNGYDASQQLKRIELYNKAEEARKKKALRERDEAYRLKKQQKEERKALKKKKKQEEREANGGGEKKEEGNDSESESDFGDTSDEDEDDNEDDTGVKQDGSEALAQKMFTVGTAVKATVRNLRIREDTAKYLRNLDPNSAYYDPKTRSMRANPTPHIPIEESTYAGDNFVKNTGEARDLAQMQIFSWEAQKQGETAGTHMQANPTEMMLKQKEFKERKDKLKNSKRSAVFAKYGGEEHMKKPDPTILDTEGSRYVEYSRDGRVIKGDENSTLVLSKYEEDIFPGNHTSVWGSYFDVDTGQWGFACCWQTNEKAYCVGEAGKKAKLQSLKMDLNKAKVPAPLEAAVDSNGKQTNAGYDPAEKSKLYGEGNPEVTLDPKKMKEALERARRREEKADIDSDNDTKSNGKKRKSKNKYNSLNNTGEDVTAEDMEVYRMKKVKTSDPMSQMMGKGDDYLAPQD